MAVTYESKNHYEYNYDEIIAMGGIYSLVQCPTVIYVVEDGVAMRYDKEQTDYPKFKAWGRFQKPDWIPNDLRFTRLPSESSFTLIFKQD